MPKQTEYSPIPPWRRTDYCGALRGADDGREVALWGWVAARRDHGGLIFIDLRDREGVVQLVFNPEHDPAGHRVAAAVRSEYYLVPSRVNPGKFYALPQSPQLLKQLLMVSGFDRYYQIARCFRDEDLRANRQPEFSQIDIEMTGPRPEDVMSIAEGMMASIYEYAIGVKLAPPFPQLAYADAMERFGSDKPDMRFGMEMKNLGAAFAGTSFKVFADVLARGESSYGIALPGEFQLSRREPDEMAETIRTRQGLALAWAKIAHGSWQRPIARHLSNEERGHATEAA